MSIEESLLDLCIDAYEARLKTNAHLPEADRQREARAAAKRVHKSKAPGAVVWIEKNREPVDQVAAQRHKENVRRLHERAQVFIDTVLRAANVDGDLTEAQLVGTDDREPGAWPDAVCARDQLCWELSRSAGMSMRAISLVVHMTYGSVSVAIARHEKRIRAAVNAQGKEVSNAK